MSFLSLVNTDNRIYGKISEDFFDDIKLTQLLNENVIRVMRDLPCREDIVLRQGVFNALKRESVRNYFSKLFWKLKNLKEIFDAYNTAFEIKEKQYIFCALLYYLCDFYLFAAKKNENEGLIFRFSDYFEQRTVDPDFCEMKERTLEIYKKYFRKFNLNIMSDKLVIGKKAETGYIETLRKCADSMGITLSTCDYIPRRISTEFTISLSELYPELWQDFSILYNAYSAFPDENILMYIDQLDFYLSVYNMTEQARLLNIPVCFAQITDKEKICIFEAYDITLMSKECNSIIPNDVIFDVQTPFFFLSGANGGGKTTYLRTCGVSVVLSLLGCPVPAMSSELCMLGTIGTHFPRDERFDADGRFLDEQRRVDKLLSSVNSKSLLLFNETYSTTTEKKAAQLTISLAQKMYDDKQFGVYVTHQKSVINNEIPLLTCEIDKSDENKRTFRIKRINAVGSSYAEDVLKKYALSRHDLEERFGDLG